MVPSNSQDPLPPGAPRFPESAGPAAAFDFQGPLDIEATRQDICETVDKLLSAGEQTYSSRGPHISYHTDVINYLTECKNSVPEESGQLIPQLTEQLNDLAKRHFVKLCCIELSQEFAAIEDEVGQVEASLQSGDKEQALCDLEALMQRHDFARLKAQIHGVFGAVQSPSPSSNQETVKVLINKYLVGSDSLLEQLESKVTQVDKRISKIQKNFPEKANLPEELFERVDLAGSLDSKKKKGPPLERLWARLEHFFSHNLYSATRRVGIYAFLTPFRFVTKPGNPTLRQFTVTGTTFAAFSFLGVLPATFLAIRGFISDTRKLGGLHTKKLRLKSDLKAVSEARKYALGEFEKAGQEGASESTINDLKEGYQALCAEEDKLKDRLRRVKNKIALTHLSRGTNAVDLAVTWYWVIDSIFIILEVLQQNGWAISKAAIDGFTTVSDVLGPIFCGIGIVFGGIGIGLSYYDFTKTSKKLNAVNKTYNNLKNNPDPKSDLLKKFRSLELQKTILKKKELEARRRSDLLMIAKNTVLTAAAVLGLAAFVTHGATGIALTVVVLGAAVAALGMTIYDMIKQKELQKELTLIKEELPNQDQLTKEIAASIQGKAATDEEIQEICEWIGMSKGAFLLDPERILQDRFAALAVEE